MCAALAACAIVMRPVRHSLDSPRAAAPPTALPVAPAPHPPGTADDELRRLCEPFAVRQRRHLLWLWQRERRLSMTWDQFAQLYRDAEHAWRDVCPSGGRVASLTDLQAVARNGGVDLTRDALARMVAPYDVSSDEQIDQVEFFDAFLVVHRRGFDDKRGDQVCARKRQEAAPPQHLRRYCGICGRHVWYPPTMALLCSCTTRPLRRRSCQLWAPVRL